MLLWLIDKVVLVLDPALVQDPGPGHAPGLAAAPAPTVMSPPKRRRLSRTLWEILMTKECLFAKENAQFCSPFLKKIVACKIKRS